MFPSFPEPQTLLFHFGTLPPWLAAANDCHQFKIPRIPNNLCLQHFFSHRGTVIAVAQALMRSFYVACDLGVESGRVMLGALNDGTLTMSEVRQFPNRPVQDKTGLQWNIPQLYQDVVAGLSEIGTYEETVDSISCTSWAGDYLLFDANSGLITPTFHHADPRLQEGRDRVLTRVPLEAIYDETGVQHAPGSTLFQLGAEKARRLSKAAHLLPVADAFNYLLAGVPRAEISMASTTQLWNPVTGDWSRRLLDAVDLPPSLLPPLVPSGTPLGPLLPEIAQRTSLEDTQVVSSCSHEMAAALLGLPVAFGENWAFLRVGSWAMMGTEITEPIINETSRHLNFTNEIGYGGLVRFSKQTAGLWILEECRRFWKQQDREIDDDLLTHLAGSAPAFEALINPNDPRFLTPGDMPLKIQAYCRDTKQRMPRKPGPIIRCVLESVALLHRKTLSEIEHVTGRKVDCLYLMGSSTNPLLNHFTANAVQRPVIVAPSDIAPVGNVIGQALALGHIQSLAEAREIVRSGLKLQKLIPYAVTWDAAYARLSQLLSS
jgi:rhamnulokinase